MIIVYNQPIKIDKFINNLIPDNTNIDRIFLKQYLYKALLCCNDLTEVSEYCTQEFADELGRVTGEEKRIYPLESLQKDKFMSLVFFYKGVTLL